MTRLEKTVAWAQGVALAAACAAAIVVDRILAPKIGDYRSVLVTAASAAVLLKIVEFVTSSVVEGWPWARRIIMGQEFIEGTWVEIVTDGARGIVEGGVARIRFRKGRYRFSGETYSSDGGLLHGSFDSLITEYEDFELLYLYRETEQQRRAHPRLGSGILRFPETAKCPERYQASFFDPIHRSEAIVGWGNKLTDKADLEMVNTAQGRKELFSRFSSSVVAQAATAPQQFGAS